MKRFIDNLPTGTPIINSDFHDILQEQHRIAYSAYYDGLNDEKYSTFSSDRGIIIRGCEVTSSDPVSGSLQFVSGVVQAPFSYTIDFTDSLVYFDGQFCEPLTDLLSPSPIFNIQSNSTGFYLYPVTSSRIVDFRDGKTHSISIDYRFDYTPTLSTIPSSAPYVKFEYGGTSRRLSRLLRLSSAVKDDILISSDVVKWTYPAIWNTGVGSFGNILEILGTFGSQIWRDFNVYNGVGRNEMKGFRILTEMGGRFMVGYDSSSIATTPVNAGLLQFNYGTPSNYGGTHALTFSKAQLPAHNHGGFTGTTSNSLDHAHPLQCGANSFDQILPPSDVDLIYYGLPIDGNSPITEINLLTRQVPLFSPNFSLNDQIGKENTDITDHTHQIDIAGSDTPHENRPPYSVVLYYTKI
jgi:hypothetical protein